MASRVARVFARRTKASPVDELAFYDIPGFFPIDVDEVHVSVTFGDDIPRAEWLARAWERVAKVKVGGPASGVRGEGFIPGMYLRPGYVITSRGCNNHCWFCQAWRREGPLREIPITEGWNVLDDNLLACSDDHIRAVFNMLKQQTHRVEFSGGLEAAKLERWHVELLRDLKPKQIFFAYDTPDDFEPLVAAGKILLEAGFTRAGHVLRCFVLIGYPNDTMGKAEARCSQAFDAGFLPMAMLWDGNEDLAWQRFQRRWARPAIMAHKPNDSQVLLSLCVSQVFRSQPTELISALRKSLSDRLWGSGRVCYLLGF